MFALHSTALCSHPTVLSSAGRRSISEPLRRHAINPHQNCRRRFLTTAAVTGDADDAHVAVKTASRREAMALAALLATSPMTTSTGPAYAAAPKVFVVGATGATGRLVVDELRNKGGADVVAGVRSADKAQKLGIDKGGVALSPGFDVTAPGSALAGALGGVDAVIICTGFVPGNPFKMSEAAHAVDNEGVIHVVDACKQAGVKKVVLISSILTNGRGWGAQDSPGFKITNAFGNVLDEKLVGEKYLQASGLDWCIVRPAGLKDGTAGKLIIMPGDTMASGEIDRKTVAQVMVEAAFSDGSRNRIVEIAEEGTFAGGYTPDGYEKYLVGGDRATWFA